MTPSGQSVCLCMIVRNEASVIRACLASVRPVIDSWVVVDTGSHDGTQGVVAEAMADLPGNLYERPWRDFAHNRSEALELARPLADYSFVMDADDTLELPAGYALPDLHADSYSLDVALGETLFRRPQLARSALPWRYRGVLHEYIDCPAAGPCAHLAGPLIRMGHGGARRRDPQTYLRDAEVLERTLATETDAFLHARYTFYLAQSLRDCGEPQRALGFYLRRAEQGFWSEEVYCALLEAARLMLRLGRTLEEMLAPLERAMTINPARAEALHAASLACRLHSDFGRGARYGEAAARTPMPNEGLFLERWVYDYGALDEQAINSFWAGGYRACLDAVLRGLASGRVPEGERSRWLANARVAADRLASAGAIATSTQSAGAHAMEPPRPLQARLPDPPPRVLVAILAKQKASVLPLYLSCIEALDYPKSRIVLYVRTNNNTDATPELLRGWLDRVGHLYAAVEYDDTDVDTPVESFGVHEWNPVRFRVLNAIRDVSLAKTAEHGCDLYFTADSDNFVRPCTLRELVATGLPIVAPLLRHIEPERLYSNYHAAIDAAGYYAESDIYQPVLFRSVTGLIELPVVHCTYVVRADAAARLGYNDGSQDYDYVIFSRHARAGGIVQYLDNRQLYGYITLDDADPERVAQQIESARRLLDETRPAERLQPTQA